MASGDVTIPPEQGPNNPPDYTIPATPQPAKGSQPSVVASLLLPNEQIVKSLASGIIKPKFYKIDQSRVSREGDSLEAPPSVGLLGLPVYDTVTFDEFSYDRVDGTSEVVLATKYVNVLIEVSRPKNIVETKIQGREKEVNEYLSGGNYFISIKGSLVGQDANKPPLTEKAKLIKYSDVPVEIPVSSDFLLEFGIKSLIIREATFKQVEATRNVIEFHLDCKDEVPFEIKSNA